MANSDRETPRLVAVPASTESRLVNSCRPEIAGESDTVCRSADTRAAIVPNRPNGIAGISGCSTHEPSKMASRPGKAAGSTTSGPYVTNVPCVLDPLAAI